MKHCYYSLETSCLSVASATEYSRDDGIISPV